MNSSPSVASLASTAPEYLAKYCDESRGYAWPTYDIDDRRGSFAPTDVLAPAFLSYPIKGAYLNEMFRREAPRNPYAMLLASLETAATTPDLQTVAFEALPLDELTRRSGVGWGVSLNCLDAVQPCKGITSVAVTKILHRKLPDLVPVNDSRIRAFYEVTDGYATLFERLHADLKVNLNLIDDWRRPYRLPDGRSMSRLRALDIAIWMHMADQSYGEDDSESI